MVGQCRIEHGRAGYCMVGQRRVVFGSQGRVEYGVSPCGAPNPKSYRPSLSFFSSSPPQLFCCLALRFPKEWMHSCCCPLVSAAAYLWLPSCGCFFVTAYLWLPVGDCLVVAALSAESGG